LQTKEDQLAKIQSTSIIDISGSAYDVALVECDTHDMIADILTKPLNGTKFIKLRNLLLITNQIPIDNLHQHAHDICIKIVRIKDRVE
jgi:hypothetical protein